MATPHISAEKGDFAKTVLMPGDPLRAKFIAETFLEDPVQVNDVRGILGYTGTYKGVKVSVMASGMGCPSMGIYSYELFSFYDVENIIRVGSAGALTEKLKVRDIVAGIGTHHVTGFADCFNMAGTLAPMADYTLLSTAVEAAKEQGIEMHVGPLLCYDAFYSEGGMADKLAYAKMGALAIEMESVALYLNALRLGKRALVICTISDHLVTGEETTSAERQTTFTQMMEIALETAVKMEGK